MLKGTLQNDQSHTFDINADGRPDLLSISSFNKTVMPYFQNEEGEFEKGELTELFEHPYSSIEAIYPGKFNKDEYLDLVVVYDSHFIAFYQGNHLGEFYFHSEYEIPFGKFLVSASGDLDSDGQLEIIVSPFQVDSNRFSLFIFSNNENNFNQFPFSVKYQLVHLSSLLTKVRSVFSEPDIEKIDGIHIGEFNHDHLKDIILLDREQKRVITLLSNNLEKYQPSEILRFPFHPYEISLLKLNNDQEDDLLVTPAPGSHYHYTHTYLRSNDKFIFSQMLPLGEKIFDVKKGNFFKKDEQVYVASSKINSELIFYRPKTNGRIDPKEIKKISVLEYPGKLNCSDLNNDGIMDLIVTGSSLDNSSLSIFKNISLED